MAEPTAEELDEHVRRLLQIRTTDPAELTDADLEAMALAYKDGCVRMAAAELLAARARLAPPERYPAETLPEDDDDGTMPDNVAKLREHVIGRRIVAAEKVEVPNEVSRWGESGLRLTLDDGMQVYLIDSSDCCAYTSLTNFFLNPTAVSHAITGVGTTGGYTKWHIFADFGDMLNLDVEWSCGNPFYYGYGFDIAVVPVEAVVPRA